MSSGMNTEQAKEYAKTMTYTEAVSNIKHAKGIKYRKATMIKIRELAEIADRLDSKTEPTISKMEQVDEPQIYGNKHNCIMTLFGDCSYAETGCGSCEVVKKVRKALDKYKPKNELQTNGILFKGNLKEGNYKLIKTTDGWVLADEDIVYCGWEMGNE